MKILSAVVLSLISSITAFSDLISDFNALSKEELKQPATNVYVPQEVKELYELCLLMNTIPNYPKEDCSRYELPVAEKLDLGTFSRNADELLYKSQKFIEERVPEGSCTTPQIDRIVNAAEKVTANNERIGKRQRIKNYFSEKKAKFKLWCKGE